MESSGPEKALAFGLLGVAAAGLKKDAPRHVTAGCLATAIAFACVGGAGSALSKPEKRVAVALCGVVGFPAVAEIANRLFNLAFARAHFFPKGRTQLFNGRPAAEYAMGQGLFDVETGERIDTSSLDDKSFGAVKKNNFIRNTTAYRDRISDAETTVSEGDLVLFANGGCPWAHRVVVTRALLGLESAIPLLSTKRGFGGLYTLPAVSTMGWELDEPLPDAVCERSEALRSLRASFVRSFLQKKKKKKCKNAVATRAFLLLALRLGISLPVITRRSAYIIAFFMPVFLYEVVCFFSWTCGCRRGSRCIFTTFTAPSTHTLMGV